MHKHHVIPRHEWKVRFGNLRGFNAPDNIVNLTVEQHAQAHQSLYELNHNEYDSIASLALLKLIGKEEAYRLAVSNANKGNKYTLGLKRSEKQKKQHSEFMKGREAWNKGKTNIYSAETLKRLQRASMGHTHNRGRSHTEQSRKNMSNAHLGNRHSEETKLKMKESRLRHLESQKVGI